MQLFYGSYSFNANDVYISHTRNTMRAQTMFRTGYIDRWTINFRLSADTQAELTTAIEELYSVFAVDGRDIILKDNSGNNSAFITQSAATTSGTRIDSIVFSDLVGAQYTTFVDGVITAEAETVTNVSAELSFSDSFTVTGNGGPKIVVLETAFSSPIVQVTRQRTAVRAIQAGRARAIGAIPPPPNMMFPNLLINESVQDSITASTEGGKAVYERSWSYPYQSAQYFSGVPIARF